MGFICEFIYKYIYNGYNTLIGIGRSIIPITRQKKKKNKLVLNLLCLNDAVKCSLLYYVQTCAYTQGPWKFGRSKNYPPPPYPTNVTVGRICLERRAAPSG